MTETHHPSRSLLTMVALNAQLDIQLNSVPASLILTIRTALLCCLLKKPTNHLRNATASNERPPSSSPLAQHPQPRTAREMWRPDAVASMELSNGGSRRRYLACLMCTAAHRAVLVRRVAEKKWCLTSTETNGLDFTSASHTCK